MWATIVRLDPVRTVPVQSNPIRGSTFLTRKISIPKAFVPAHCYQRDTPAHVGMLVWILDNLGEPAT